MAKYSYITDKTHNNRKIQVESAKRDGSGKNFENNYAKQNGNYQSLTAGLSNNFDTKLTEKDESAYNFRPTATMGSMELEVGSPCKVKKIVGGSVAWNQEVQQVIPTTESKGITFTKVNDYTLTISGTTNDRVSYSINYNRCGVIHNHIYLLRGMEANTQNIGLIFNGYNDSTYATTYSGRDIGQGIIVKSTNSNVNNVRIEVVIDYANTELAKTYTIKPQFFDLTQMFGSTIADYIYSLEQAEAGSGVAWFKRYFPKEYYAYNSGELVSVKTQGKKITHFNQWDEEWELGFIDGTTGQNSTSSTTIRSKNYIRVIPNIIYYYKAPYYCNIRLYDASKNYLGYVVWAKNTTNLIGANVHYIRFVMPSEYGTTYNHDVCINFHYDGERDGEYEPYNSQTYSCDDVELRGIPQLDENNNLAFDGDEYLADGNVTRKMGQDELSDLTYTEETYNGVHYFFAKADPNYATNIDARGIMGYCSVYGSGRDSNDLPLDGCIGFNVSYKGGGYTIAVRDDSISTRTQLKNKLTGKGAIIYPLKTPTDENSVPFTEVQECDNWGTEEWLAPTTDTRPCEVPVGHETDYLPDLKAKLEVAPTTPSENGVYVMEHNASGNSYTPIATWLSDNGYVKSTDVANGYGTKDALGGTLRQLLATKESLDFLNIDVIDLSSLSWQRTTSYANPFFYATITNAKNGGKSLTTKYKNISPVNSSTFGNANNMEQTIAYDNNQVFIRNDAYTDATTFKNAMKGILLAYEKAS